MRRVFRYVVIAVVVLFAATSCYKKAEENFVLSVDYTTFDIEAGSLENTEDNRCNFYIYTSDSWELSVEPADTPWLNVTPKKGKGRTVVFINYQYNSTDYIRKADIIIRGTSGAAAGKECVINVKQAKAIN